MALVPIENLALLRILVGYLGEREQHAWWQSSFFGQGRKSFLVHVFGKMPLLAQCTGVTQAAALLHDDRIGIGNVYHLFRLSEDLEQAIRQSLHRAKLGQQITALLMNQTTALAYLQDISGVTNDIGIGPTQIGNSHDLRNQDSWAKVAALYRTAFQTNNPIYPYFTERAS